MKKPIAIFLCLTTVLLLACSCSKKNEDTSSAIPASSAPVAEKVLNPLTGTPISKEQLSSRPVAIMINNISFAQAVQTGINKADIVYETEVEGGITRIMLVFKDINSVKQLGTVRSARYPYIDMALGHDAIYVHCGQDNVYCKPHLKDIDDVSINTGIFGCVRISNGLNTEHTLYTYGDKLLAGIKETNIRTTTDKNTPWLDFTKDDEKVTLTGGTANSVEVPFSSSYHTVFKYDSQKGEYTRYFGSNIRKDYVTGETTDVKNVFVLLTDISFYPNHYRRKVDLNGGEGYYLTNGTYQKIKWSKGAANNSLKFTDENGKELKVSAGKSWVCFAGKSSTPTIN
ncbi:MAG: DUF3048 domain-containing protein [Clostridia bacterium]|nr:DUF3048 domain-containing protein [Clostridia bacterium]